MEYVGIFLWNVGQPVILPSVGDALLLLLINSRRVDNEIDVERATTTL
jgi:hypothetical protein